MSVVFTLYLSIYNYLYNHSFFTQQDDFADSVANKNQGIFQVILF